MTEGARRGKEALSLSGGHLCHACGHQYPNPNPSAKLRRSHRRNSCTRKTTTPDPEDDAAAAGEERNAAEGPLALAGGGGGGLGYGDGDGPGNGAASGGSASPGSAEGGGEPAEDKENADEGNGTNLAKACTNGVQHKVPKTSTEIAPLAVAHPAEREDSIDEYQDASSFLPQSDPEDGTAVADESDIPMEIKNLDKDAVGISVAADAISVKMNGLGKDEFSKEPSMPSFPAGSKVKNKAECYLGNITPRLVGCEDGLNLQSTEECSADIGSNDAHFVVDRKPDKTSDYCEFIDDLNSSSLQKCSLLMSDPESQSVCPRKADSFLIDGMDVLDSMSEVSPRAEIAGSENSGSETISNSGTNSLLTGDQLKVIHNKNTSADCPMERFSHNFSVQDTSDVQLPVDSSCLLNSTCCEPGHRNDLAVTNFDGLLKSIAQHIHSDGILIKGSELDSSSEEKPQQVEQIVTAAEGNTSLEKHNGYCSEEVCNRENDTEVPTKYQVSSSQEHVTLLMDQVSSIKNPFNLDDTRSEDLFELSSGSYHFEEPNVVESKQHVDSTTLTVSSITGVAGGQHCLISDGRDRMVPVSSENGYAVCAEDLSVSSSADPTKNIVLHDASVNHSKQGGESHTNGTSCVLSQVLPTEFSTMPVSQEINALSTYVGEMTETEETSAKDMAAEESIDNFEEKKQTEDASAKEVNTALLTEIVEEEKQAEGSGVKETVDENNRSESTDSREMRAVQSTVNVHEKDQTEDSSAKKVDTELCTDDADNRQTDDTNKEEMYEEQPIDKAEEKKQAQETSAKETNEDNVEGQKQAEGIVLKGNRQNEEIAAIGSSLNSARISVPLKVLLAEASLESKEKKPSTKERVLSFRRRPSLKDDAPSAKPGSVGSDNQYWNSPARLAHRSSVDKRSRVRKQPWMPFICCHSVH